MRNVTGVACVLLVMVLYGCGKKPAGPRVIAVGDSNETARTQLLAYGFEETMLQMETAPEYELEFWHIKKFEYLVVSHRKADGQIVNMTLDIFSEAQNNKGPEKRIRLKAFDLVAKRGVTVERKGG